MFSCKGIFVRIPAIACIHTSVILRGKDTSRQVKILGKLLGQKVSGSRKRWYPTIDILPHSKNLTKTKHQGKTSARRVTVLNKLFMRHVTDLLATGEASEEIVGKGLEISRVKVTTDFQGVNVYWIAKGDTHDDEMEAALNKCSGVLRHELSQLRLMGHVPKIQFIKDKLYANLAEVENILQKCDFGDEHKRIDASDIISDFVGYSENNILVESEGNTEDNDEHLPPMRHDVLGLNHNAIMGKILTRMKKSNQAWALHELNIHSSEYEDDKAKLSATEDLYKKLEESKLKEDEFRKFLKRKKYAKNTPDRKKDFNYYEDYATDLHENETFFENTRDEGDYIEEHEKDKF